MDGGKACANCLEMRKKKGGSNPGTKLNNWHKTLTRAIERGMKSELTASDMEDCRNFVKTPTRSFNRNGVRLVRQVSLIL